MTLAPFARGNISIQEPDGRMTHFTDAAFFAIVVTEKKPEPSAALIADLTGEESMPLEIAVRTRSNSPEELGELFESVLPVALARAILASVGNDPAATIEALTAISYGIAAECVKLSQDSPRRITLLH